MLIPIEHVSQETLNALIEEFITREGTDYGAFEVGLQEKVLCVHQQLKTGEVVLVFDMATESANLMTKHQHQHQETEAKTM